MQYQETKKPMHASFLFLLGIFFFTFNLKKNAFGVLWGHEGTSS